MIIKSLYCAENLWVIGRQIENDLMNFEIIETPIRFQLVGLMSEVQNNRVGNVGVRLMDAMWKIVKETRTVTMGKNHWVYLPDGQMLVGVELAPSVEGPTALQPLTFELHRYLKHVHVGPYQLLPSKWADLRSRIADLHESICSPSLEIYGHHHEDASKLETTILIALRSK